MWCPSLLLLPIILCQYNIERRDPLAYLSKSLAVFHAEVSDGSVLRMKCPPDTQVFIQKQKPFFFRFYQVVLQQVAYGSQSCTVHEAVRTVEEKCHGNNECLVMVEPATFVIEFPDPCPNKR